MLLQGKRGMPMIGVKDLKQAKRFYDQLGLQRHRTEEPGMLEYDDSAGLTITVYETQFGGTNKATAITWAVGDDFDEIVNSLKAKGISFEHYTDLPDTRVEGDVHVSGERRVAWFKDPDGNILSIINE
ncbi:MAG TPA: VOC family protein [Bdellovibrionales bacterium]|nr:VOC family protein [Bdellovibrionales bacterium]